MDGLAGTSLNPRFADDGHRKSAKSKFSYTQSALCCIEQNAIFNGPHKKTHPFFQMSLDLEKLQLFPLRSAHQAFKFWVRTPLGCGKF